MNKFVIATDSFAEQLYISDSTSGVFYADPLIDAILFSSKESAQRFIDSGVNAGGSAIDLSIIQLTDEQQEMVSPIKGMFGRKDDVGNVVVLMAADGAAVTRMDVDAYPVGSGISVRYEHPSGIIITAEDAVKIGLPVE